MITWLEDDEVIVKKEDLADLQRDSKCLAALEAGGVDNWEWYSESINMYFPEYFHGPRRFQRSVIQWRMLNDENAIIR